MSERIQSSHAKSNARKDEKRIHTYYVIQDDKITGRPKKCPRCGSFMAFHKDNQQRWACGSCSYTQFVTTSQQKSPY